ncbi:mitochondrial distribution and morphology protein family 31/32 [Sanghuangporus baumii]|uniref:Mitochondrial distribution and morphology protein family 31/32 n=1 Tax=Sanghuangporus baumii TaxID=108892 RepID=A0A9Q5HYR7_SANBA|nr:mitochondrial distribution and morphology protein family 31/32 [Sanghuangporus baumii]
MQISRCIRASVRRRIVPCLSLDSSEAAACNRYIIIRNFFKQEIHAVENHPRTRPLPSHGHILRLHIPPLQACNRPKSRLYHTSPRLQEGKPVNGESKEPIGSTNAHKAVEKNVAKGDEHGRYQHLENYSRFFHRLAMSLPPIPRQRPTRDDLLKVATSFWQRLRIRFKWITIKSFRKFNADEISAFVTWFVMSQTAWILIGTTTFFSVVFATLNSLRLQEYVARAISNYLTSETGITIIFESAIVPKWKDSRIAFKNVYISRRPRNMNDTSQVDPNAGHKAAALYDIHNHPAYHGLDDERAPPLSEVGEDTNYMFFDLNIDSVDVTFSLWRWLDGKGLVEDAIVKGVRGVLDRRHIFYDPDQPLNPADFRHPARPGDFELESLQVEDLLVTIYQPGDFRPFTFSIFRADINTFRKQWLFYDFLSADSVVGQYDNCLFSLHKPQSIGRTMEQEMKDGQWARMARFRIDGVNIDHLKRATIMEGPVSWITSGKFDAVLDIRFPHTEQTDINALLGELAEAISSAASAQAARFVDRIPGQRELARPAISAPEDVAEAEVESTATQPVVSIDIDLRFRDVKASVPIFSRDLSYVNNALIRPIVAFINANKTLVPIRCRVIKELSEFDGAWTMWETGLMNEISLKLYEALAYHVTQANFNHRVKTVGVWSLQKTIIAALQALQAVMQPMSVYLPHLHLREPGPPLVEWGNMLS